MKKFLYLVILMFLFSTEGKTDVGNFDVIEYTNQNEKIYIRIWSLGVLKNHDLCYYNWDGEYVDEVQTTVANRFSNYDSITIYADLVKIDLKKIDRQYEIDSILYVLQNLSKITKMDFTENYIISDAYRGNTAGFTSTSNFSNDDNDWINDYEIEKIFGLTDYELCEMDIYTIKGNMARSESEILKQELDGLLKAFRRADFYERLRELHSRNIIMIGLCSC